MNDHSFEDTIEKLGARFAARAAEHDDSDTFVAENFADLREARLFSATVPESLGGGGVSHRRMARGLRTLAGHCGSTALALSMHQHLVAAQVWNHRHGKPGEAVLRKVAANELVLVSTGANDWLSSNGRLERTEGGYRLTARKTFASGSPAGNVLVTSAPYEDPGEGWQVLHFPVPFSAEGVRVQDDWKTMGMRGTGSNTVVLENVFIPEDTVGLRRPRGAFHPVWGVILTVAMPYIMAVYVGIAESAADIARTQAKKRGDDETLPSLLGELENELTSARLAHDSMVELANDWDFEPSMQGTSEILVRKTLAARASLATVEKALEVAGGSHFFRSHGLERRLRDVHAGQFHPLSEKKQALFTGRVALGLDPVARM